MKYLASLFLLVAFAQLSNAVKFTLDKADSSNGGLYSFLECSANIFHKRIAKVLVRDRTGYEVERVDLNKVKGLTRQGWRLCRKKTADLSGIKLSGNFVLEFLDRNGQRMSHIPTIAIKFGNPHRSTRHVAPSAFVISDTPGSNQASVTQEPLQPAVDRLADDSDLPAPAGEEEGDAPDSSTEASEDDDEAALPQPFTAQPDPADEYLPRPPGVVASPVGKKTFDVEDYSDTLRSMFNDDQKPDIDENLFNEPVRMRKFEQLDPATEATNRASSIASVGTEGAQDLQQPGVLGRIGNYVKSWLPYGRGASAAEAAEIDKSEEREPLDTIV